MACTCLRRTVCGPSSGMPAVGDAVRCLVFLDLGLVAAVTLAGIMLCFLQAVSWTDVPESVY